MTYENFCNKHLNIDYITDKATLKNIVLKNIKVGKEAINLARLFDIPVSSLMMESGVSLSGFTHSEDYLSYANMNGRSFIASEANLQSSYVPEYWFDVTMKDYCERIALEYPTDDLQDDSNVKSMYKLFGMKILDD